MDRVLVFDLFRLCHDCGLRIGWHLGSWRLNTATRGGRRSREQFSGRSDPRCSVFGSADGYRVVCPHSLGPSYQTWMSLTRPLPQTKYWTSEREALCKSKPESRSY